MHTFVEEMKRNSAISAIVTTLIGIVLVLYPDTAGRVMCYILGAGLILMGVVQLIISIRAERIGIYSRFSMVMDLALFLIGIWVCSKPDSVLALVPIIVGIIMIYHGFMDISYTLDMKNAGAAKWWVALILALLTFAFGIALVLNPFLAYEVTMMLVGIVLLYDGGTDVILLIAAWITQRRSDKRVREFTGNAEDISSADDSHANK